MFLERHYITVNGLRLAYHDSGGDGTPILALHGHFSRGNTFAGVVQSLDERWRFVALDQRGHGWSDHPGDYSRAAYVGDAAGFIQQLGLAPAIVLGHSLGGVNGYQLAARRPDLVRAMIIEDIGAEVGADFDFLTGWPRRFPTLADLRNHLIAQLGDDAYFLESAAEYPDGWGFRFDYDEMRRSQSLLNGDWWADWLGSSCPALLLHGNQSWAVQTEHVRAMAARRPDTRLVEFPSAGHTIHAEDLAGFARAVGEFLGY